MENTDLNKYLETLIKQIKKEIKTSNHNSEKAKDFVVGELLCKHTSIDLPKAKWYCRDPLIVN